ncbi:MAG: hypothetical protein AAFV53_22815 [Myxococcota bacterium]
MNRSSTVGPLLGYLLLACWSTWPAPIQLGAAVPGSARTDIWNSLWSLWFFQYNTRINGLSLHTELISFPRGGELLVADPLNALLAAPLLPFIGVDVTYTLLVLAQLTFAGVFAHGFARELLPDAPGAGWIAGTAFATAPVLLSGVHNGTSESFAGAWTVLGVWLAWRAARFGGARRVALAVFGVLLGALASWYSAVVVFLFVGAMVLLSPAAGWRDNLSARLSVFFLGILAVVPFAALFKWASATPGNLVAIKTAREMNGIRRSTGPADLLGYFAIGDYRSPDFRVLSRYGEAFFHCHYLGYVLIIGAILSLWQARGPQRRFLWLAAGLGFILSLGPVMVKGGMPIILGTNLVIPMPYFLIEGLPGFNALTLLFRLALAPALGAALLAAAGLGRFRYWWIAPLVILIEGRALCPLGGLPDTVSTHRGGSFYSLRDAPPGAVMNFPVVGGRGYLYEQTIHGKPVTDSLNFPNNLASKRVWDTILQNLTAPEEILKKRVGAVAKIEGVRYLVIHEDTEARPDMHDPAARIIEAHYTPLVGGGEARVYPLW